MFHRLHLFNRKLCYNTERNVSNWDQKEPLLVAAAAVPLRCIPVDSIWGICWLFSCIQLCIFSFTKHPSTVADTLISPSGKILIPGIREAVAPLSDEEWRMYQDIQFDMDNYKNKIGLNQLMYNNKVNCCVFPTFLHAPLQIMKMNYILVWWLLPGGLVGPLMALPYSVYSWHWGGLLWSWHKDCHPC